MPRPGYVYGLGLVYYKASSCDIRTRAGFGVL